MNVGKPMHITIVFKYIKEHIQDRDVVNILKLENPLYATIVSEYVKELILKRNLINIIHVLKLLYVLIFKCMKEFLVEINW